MKAMVRVLPFAAGVASAPEDAAEPANEPVRSKIKMRAGIEKVEGRFFDNPIVS